MSRHIFLYPNLSKSHSEETDDIREIAIEELVEPAVYQVSVSGNVNESSIQSSRGRILVPG